MQMLNVNLTEEYVVQIKSRIAVNADVNVKKHHICEKDYIWNSATCCENSKYLVSIIDDNSVISYHEIIENKKAIPTNFNGKKQPVKRNFSIFYLQFY